MSDSSMFDMFVYTYDLNQTHIYFQRDVPRNLSAFSPSTVLFFPSSIYETQYHQDNPHLDRINVTNTNELILLYDSDNKLPSSGGKDIFYSLSYDNGHTWSVPLNMNSINTGADDTQPHLFYNITSATYYLYWSTVDTSTGKLGIYRAQQTIAGQWNAWPTPELVIAAGMNYRVTLLTNPCIN